MSDMDVVVVGAGAAGVGAGLALAERGLSCIILEAADRVGGRAFTDRATMPFAWDQGCQWLHCADVNPLVAWADRLGAQYLKEARFGDYHHHWSAGRWVDEAERKAIGTRIDTAFERLYAMVKDLPDVAITEIVPEAAGSDMLVRNLMQLMASADPEDESASGYCDYADTERNWPVTSGYGDLIERMAQGLPIRLGQAASAIRERPGGVVVVTPSGEITARAVIVTVSSNVLLSGALDIAVPEARPVLEAISAFPCGSYEKICMALRRPVAGMEQTLFFDVEPDNKPPLNIQMPRWNRQALIGHVGGSVAKGLSEAGPAALEDFMRERLLLAFGTDFAGEIEQVATTAWQGNPLVQGAYSAARPGRAQERRDAIAAHTGRVAFAGEAFSLQWQATAHGAYQTGQDAVARLAATEL
jgi:monoamine oxidase